MKRTLLMFAFLVIGCLAVGAATAQAAAPAPATVALSTSPALTLDPFLGGDLQTRVPMARFCRDSGQCEFMPNGDPCDTPIGCVCGWSGGQRACGRWH